MIYYISDLHLGDQRIIELCKRPFASIDDYEKYLIDKWNSKITKDDDVYLLGDMGCSIEIVKSFISKVNGRKHLIIGNHDEEYVDDYKHLDLFVNIDKLLYINDSGRRVCVCHYPLMDWFYGSQIIYHVYGHIHNKNAANSGYLYQEIENYYKNKPAFNASVDVINFEPVTLDELIKMKEEK